VHLVGFTIEIYYEARPYARQTDIELCVIINSVCMQRYRLRCCSDTMLQWHNVV